VKKEYHLEVFGEEMRVVTLVHSESYKRRGFIALGKTKAVLVFRAKEGRVILPLIRDKVIGNIGMTEDYGFLAMDAYLDDNEIQEYPELDVFPTRKFGS